MKKLTCSLLFCLIAVGCSSDPGPAKQGVPFSGKLKFADGKPVAQVRLTFLPQFTGGGQASATTDESGNFKSSGIVGKYVFTVTETEKTKPEVLKSVPNSYRVNTPENSFELTSPDQTIDLQVK